MAATLRSEWGKTWSVRSGWLCLVGAALLVAFVATSLANDFAHDTTTGHVPPDATMATIDAVGPALLLGSAAFAMFAVLLVTSEYTTGSIRSTFQAQPRRHVVLAGKAVIAAGCALVSGAATAAAAYAGSEYFLTTHAAGGAPSLVDTAVRGGVLCGVEAVLVVGLGAVVRRSVGTLATALVLLTGTVVLPDRVNAWTPGGQAARLLDSASDGTDQLVALAVLVAWSAAVYGLGAVLLHRRDA